MPVHYSDKSWKQNRFPHLKCAEGETTITRSVFDRWDGDVAGVLKAMKISFVQKMADRLVFTAGVFEPMVSGHPTDNPDSKQFQHEVINIAMACGHRLKDSGSATLATALADDKYNDNYAELTDIFDDVMVQLSDAIHIPDIDIVFKEERKEDHPLMAMRILRRIKASVYKTKDLDECITAAQTCAANGPAWTASGITKWLSDLDTAHMDIRHCGGTPSTADACIIKLSLKALAYAPDTVQGKPVDWKFKSSKWLDSVEDNAASMPFHTMKHNIQQQVKEMPHEMGMGTTLPTGVSLQAFNEAAKRFYDATAPPVRGYGDQGRGGSNTGRGRGR